MSSSKPNRGKTMSTQDDLDISNLDESSPPQVSRYLDDAARSYFNKMANSCPPKVNSKPENIKLNEANPRRSLMYDSQPMLFQIPSTGAASDMEKFINMVSFGPT